MKVFSGCFTRTLVEGFRFEIDAESLDEALYLVEFDHVMDQDRTLCREEISISDVDINEVKQED